MPIKKMFTLILILNLIFANTSITIYNQNRAHINEHREVHLDYKGIQKLVIPNIPSTADPSSINLFSDEIQFISKEFLKRSITTKSLLDDLIGEKIELVKYDKDGKISFSTFGKLISNINKPVLTLFPGSRKQELQKHLDVLVSCSLQIKAVFPEIQIGILSVLFTVFCVIGLTNSFNFIDGVEELAKNGVIPGGTKNNFNFNKKDISFEKDIKEHQKFMLSDAQTAGGLLIATPHETSHELLEKLNKNSKYVSKIIGSFIEKGDKNIFVK